MTLDICDTCKVMEAFFRCLIKADHRQSIFSSCYQQVCGECVKEHLKEHNNKGEGLPKSVGK